MALGFLPRAQQMRLTSTMVRVEPHTVALMKESRALLALGPVPQWSFLKGFPLQSSAMASYSGRSASHQARHTRDFARMLGSSEEVTIFVSTSQGSVEKLLVPRGDGGEGRTQRRMHNGWRKKEKRKEKRWHETMFGVRSE